MPSGVRSRAVLAWLLASAAHACAGEPEAAVPSAVSREQAQWQVRVAAAHEHAARRAASEAQRGATQTGAATAAPPARPQAARLAAARTSDRTDTRMPEVDVVQDTLDADEARRRARDAVRVVMYATSWCGVCTSARRYFRAEHVAFVEHDVDRDPAASRRHRALNPRGSVPTIAIDDEVMVGFGPASFERARAAAIEARASRIAASGPKTIELRGRPEARAATR